MQEEGPDGEGAPHDGVTRYQRDTERETTQDTGESYTITHNYPIRPTTHNYTTIIVHCSHGYAML